MKSRDAQNWSVKWSNIGKQGHDIYVALFSCPFINTNIIYTKQQVIDALSEEDSSSIPKQVMLDALEAIGIKPLAA